MIALAINLVACSNDNNEISTTPTVAVEKASTFNPNPTPEDYNSAEFLSFKNNVTTSKTNANAKTAAYVSATIPDLILRRKLVLVGAAVWVSAVDGSVLIDNTRGGLNLEYLSTDTGKITNLSGIQAYTNLVQLSVIGQNLTTISIAGLSNLSYIDCRENTTLTTLNLSAQTKLNQIWCNSNPLLSSLTLPANTTTLWGLWCYGDNLSSLNLNGNANLTSLFCQSNKLTNTFFNQLLSAPYYNSLGMINFSNNKMTTLNLVSKVNLTAFWCSNNTLLTYIDLKNKAIPPVLFNANIGAQDFRYNASNCKINVETNFLSSANTAWPNRGSSTYVSQ